MRLTTTFGIVSLLASATAGRIQAQDSRLAEIAAQQEKKAAEAPADQRPKVERALLHVKEHDWVQRFTQGLDGITPKFGGMAAGTGFALGARYKRSDILGGRMTFSTSAASSFRGDRRLDAELSAPKLAGGRVFTTLYAVRHEYSRMHYYGPGANSEKTGRTDFKLEDTAIDGTIGLRASKRVTIGASAGYVFNNIGPGSDRRFAPAETTYSPQRRPGSTCNRTSCGRAHSRSTTGATIPTGRAAAATTSRSSTIIATARSARATSGGWTSRRSSTCRC